VQVVGERRRLGPKSALLPPLAAALTAAADVRDRVDHSAVQQRGQAALELWIEAGLVGTISVQQTRGAPVQGDVGPPRNGDGNRRPVPRRCDEALGPGKSRVVAWDRQSS